MVVMLPTMAVGAQTLVAQDSPRTIGETNASRVVSLLRQDGRSQNAQNLNELADSLVAIAVRPTRVERDRDLTTAAGEAVTSLGLAGLRTSKRGVRFTGALDRLITIHQRAANRGVRGKALPTMLFAGDHAPALAYLATVATADDETAGTAITTLITDATSTQFGSSRGERQATDALLHSLYGSGQVREPTAARYLDSYATSRKWVPIGSQ